MKYCSKCKKLVFSDDTKCECKGKLTEKIDLNMPVQLTAVSDVNKEIVKSALCKGKIPYSTTTVSKITPVLGVEDGFEVFYVPISFLKKGIDALVGVSAMEIPDYYDKLDLPDDPEWEEMSPFKRNAVRVLSAIGFIVLVWICVAGVDFVANLIVSLLG